MRPFALIAAAALVLACTTSAPAARAEASAADDRSRALALADADLRLRRHEPQPALAALAEPAAASWPCRDAALLLLARAQLMSGDAAGALSSADAALALGGTHRIDLAWTRAEALELASGADAAPAFLALATDDALDARRRDQALVRAAKALESAGRAQEASAAWRRAAIEAPGDSPADALARAQRLAASANVAFEQLTPAERLTIARSLRAANLNDRAASAYAEAEKHLAGAQLTSARLARAHALFDLRENEAARRACDAVIHASAGAAAECRLLSARAAWRMGDSAAVLAQVEAALKDPRLRTADERPDLWLVQGNLMLEKDRFDDAVSAFRSLLRESPRSPKAGEARWRIAWTRLLQRRPADAAAEFALLRDEQRGTELERIGALWAALASERSGRDATDALLDVAGRWPWTYQGEQARAIAEQRLDAASLRVRRAEWDASGRTVALPPEPSLAGAGGRRYALLRDAGLFRFALDEIEALARDAKGRITADDALAFELARARARAGEAPGAQALLSARWSLALQQPSRLMPKAFWEVVYPLPLRDLVQEQSDAHGIDAALCAAIIRSESAWDEEARSWADARGLMQLVPKTAALLARSEGLRDFAPDQLFDPEVNVALGARHLGELLEDLHGDIDAAIASYNAGEDKVTAWWADFDEERVPAIERVERIPYRETRQYVRRVREAMGWYRWLLACEP